MHDNNGVRIMFTQHYQIFYRAHYNTSFSPDKRAEQCVRDFNEELTQDLLELGENCGNYQKKYTDYVLLWARRKANTLSPMITGPARFPVARNARAMNAEQRAWESFRAWRERYFKAVNRKPILSPEDDLEATLDELNRTEAQHAAILEARKIVRTEADVQASYAELTKLGLKSVVKDHQAYGRWWLDNTNSSAKIRRLKAKLLALQVRIERKESFEPIAFNGGEITIIDDRVCIMHDEKPEPATIKALKSRGFRYSPTRGGWVRKHTGNAIHDAKNICGAG